MPRATWDNPQAPESPGPGAGLCGGIDAAPGGGARGWGARVGRADEVARGVYSVQTAAQKLSGLASPAGRGRGSGTGHPGPAEGAGLHLRGWDLPKSLGRKCINMPAGASLRRRVSSNDRFHLKSFRYCLSFLQ